MTGTGAQDGGDIWDAVAKAVRDRAQELNLTQLDVANRSGLGLSTIQEIWGGAQRRRQGRTWKSLSEGLSWPPDAVERILRGKPVNASAGPELRDEELTNDELREMYHRVMARLDQVEERLREIEQPPG